MENRRTEMTKEERLEKERIAIQKELERIESERRRKLALNVGCFRGFKSDHHYI